MLPNMRPLVIALPFLIASLAACGPNAGDSSVPQGSGDSGYSSGAAVESNSYEGLSIDETADAELDLASGGAASCSDLRDWYEANPGDSNLSIASRFYDLCGQLPPPVLGGELTEAVVTGEADVTAAPPARVCTRAEDIEAEVVDTTFTLGDEGYTTGEYVPSEFTAVVQLTNPTSNTSVGLQPRVKVKWSNGETLTFQREMFLGEGINLAPGQVQEVRIEKDSLSPTFGKPVSTALDGYETVPC